MKRLLPILLLLALDACIYPFDIKQDDVEIKHLVVSGDITIGEPTRITLGYVYPVGTPSGTMLKDYPKGSLTIEGDGGFACKGEYLARGTYEFDTSSAPPDQRYRLHVKLNDAREFASPWQGVNQAPVVSGLQAEPSETGLALYISLDGADSLWNFRWDYTETWEYHADFIPVLMFVPGLPAPDNEDPSKIYREPDPSEDYYYCWSSRNSVEPGLASAEGQSGNVVKDRLIMTIPFTDKRISTLYCLDVTVSGLSSGGRAYLQHLHDISNNTGSLFSPTPSDMPGNITCLSDPSQVALGYLSVVQRTTSRLFVPPTYYRQGYDPDALLFYPAPDEDGRYMFDQVYITDSPVRFSGDAPTLTNVPWAPKRCVDCRAQGGTKNKPEWWPNSHK